MAQYILRRTLFAIPTLMVISLIIFAILDLAPGDPTSQLPLTLPAEVRENIRESLGFNDPFLIQWLKWMRLMFINEPLHAIESVFNVCFGDCAARDRIISWSSRAPAIDIMFQRLPQTLWVLGLAFILGIIIAIPVGVLSAYKQYSLFDNVGTLGTMVGFSAPTFFTGLLAIVIFSVTLGWFPSFYDSTLVVNSWSSFLAT
jgi:peptide/nickel transport system permease protein